MKTKIKLLLLTATVMTLLLLTLSVQALAIVTSIPLEDKGVPLAGQTVAIVFPDGSEQEKDTDDKGILWFQFPADGSYQIVHKGMVIKTVKVDGGVATPQSATAPGQPTDEPAGTPTPHFGLSDTRPSINFKVSYRETELGDDNAPIGTVIRLGGEFAGIYAPVNFSGPEYEVEADNLGSIGIGDYPLSFSIRGWYFDPDKEKDRAVVPEGTYNVAIVYPYAMPYTGIGLGMTGLDLKIEAEYTEWGVGANLTGEYRPIGGSGWHWRPTVGLVYTDSKQEIKSTATSITYGDAVMAKNDQKLTDKFIGVPLGIEFGYPLANLFETSAGSERMPGVFFGATFTPGYRCSELSGDMDTRCDLCAESDQRLHFDYDDQEHGFSYDSEVYTGLNWPVTEHVNVGFKVAWQYRDKVAVAENVVSPGADPPYKEYGIGHDSQTGWSGSLLLGVSF